MFRPRTNPNYNCILRHLFFLLLPMSSRVKGVDIFVCISKVYQSVGLSVYQFIRLSVCQSLSLSVRQSVLPRPESEGRDLLARASWPRSLRRASKQADFKLTTYYIVHFPPCSILTPFLLNLLTRQPFNI